jgi:hypothetical protein
MQIAAMDRNLLLTLAREMRIGFGTEAKGQAICFGGCFFLLLEGLGEIDSCCAN